MSDPPGPGYGGGQSVDGPPGYGQPSSGPPGYGPPPYGPPAYGQPVHGQPSWSPPAYGQPVHGQPSWGPPPPPPGPPERPSTIQSAVALMWGGAFMTVISLPFAFLMRDEIRDILAEDQPALSSSELDTAVTFGMVAAAISAVIGLTLWSLNAVFCGRGQNWSRILGTVLFGISLLGLPLNLAQPAPGISRLLQVVNLLISVGAVVFLWLPDSNRFFRESDAARRARAYRW